MRLGRESWIGSTRSLGGLAIRQACEAMRYGGATWMAAC